MANKTNQRPRPVIVQQPALRRRRRGRRARLLTRTLPLLLAVLGLAGAAFAFGAYEAGSSGRNERTLIRNYVTAWEHKDYRAMYTLLSPQARAGRSRTTFAAALTADADIATVTALRFGRHIAITKDAASLPATITTSSFGTLHEIARLSVDAQDGAYLDYRTTMLFPGLRTGETLTRTSRLGPRGTLKADDGEVLAEGAARTSPIPTVADQIVGDLGPIPADERSHYEALGYPANAQVGVDGLERIFQLRLGGTPGGTLLAGHRRLASAAPVSGQTVRTTINPTLETAALAAVGGSYAGMTVLNARTGAVEAAVQLAFNDLQPPGSTFKIITTAAALSGHVATPATSFPDESSTSVGGYVMQNAGGEVCGGTLEEAFATSCDTTFAPLGITVGGPRLVAEAEKFGFNRPTDIPGALESTIPSAATIGGDTAVGMTAIGQGQLEASTLEMADVGQAIANDGRRAVPTFLAGAKPRFVTATSPQVAGEIQQMMIDVVNSSGGTGTSAAISGYDVAGKTGTAELANTAGQQNDTKDTDAWFVGYVPHSKADIVACALFPANGYGADSAAPAVREVLETALGLG